MPNGASPLPITVYAVSGAPRRLPRRPASALPDGATPSPSGPAGTRRTATGQGARRPIAARSARPYRLYLGTPGAEPTCSGGRTVGITHAREGKRHPILAERPPGAHDGRGGAAHRRGYHLNLQSCGRLARCVPTAGPPATGHTGEPGPVTLRYARSRLRMARSGLYSRSHAAYASSPKRWQSGRRRVAERGGSGVSQPADSAHEGRSPVRAPACRSR